MTQFFSHTPPSQPVASGARACGRGAAAMGRRSACVPAWVKRDAEARLLRFRCRVSRPALTRACTPPPQVEVQGSEEGFFGSWYLARVSSVDAAVGTITLRYTELLQDDGTAETEVLHDTSRLRPPLARWAGVPKQAEAVRCAPRAVLRLLRCAAGGIGAR